MGNAKVGWQKRTLMNLRMMRWQECLSPSHGRPSDAKLVDVDLHMNLSLFLSVDFILFLVNTKV